MKGKGVPGIQWEIYRTKPITERFVYRYLTFEKLFSFLDSQAIYLSRLDQFDDNLEGITRDQILAIEETVFLESGARSTHPALNWQEIEKRNEEEISKLKSELKDIQQKQFVSCWRLGDTESFAMWDIYGKSGFCIRIAVEKFKTCLKSSLAFQDERVNKLALLLAGKVTYVNYDHPLSVIENTVKYSAMRKHMAFDHESEFRIVGYSDKLQEFTGLLYKLKNFEQLDFSIIANPRLSEFEFDVYDKMLKKLSEKYSLKKSELVRWLNFRNL